MDIKITPASLCGNIEAISSKSDVHRLLIAAALSDQPTDILFNIYSKDITATLSALSAMGAKAEITPSGARIEPFRAKTENPLIDCDECGSTARFLLPVAAALFDSATLIGRGSLMSRPFSALTAVMRENEVNVDRDFLPITTKGRLRSGRYEIDGNISSQYITGLLFALTFLNGESEIILKTPLQSSGYVDMTLDTLRKFNINIERTNAGFFIPKDQKYRSPGALTAEGDWSNAAFWLAAGALGEGVTVKGLSPLSLQKDKQIFTILSSMGANTEQTRDIFTASHNSITATEIDAGDIPDIVPVLAAVASVASGRTFIKNASRLKIKESDRLTTVYNTLSALGANIKKTDDSLIITGRPCLHGGIVDGAGDHRIVMSAAIAASVCDNPVIIRGADAVDKSYPNFFEHYNKLGGKADVL
ncbi:MAG: 3-phosphoshikimate 1-carboxyvinyltransferase [Clostridiales bacterium]|nr:3-phosphoshikimate 1-carboxyvinyltransferase [Clostridiales bacterium]